MMQPLLKLIIPALVLLTPLIATAQTDSYSCSSDNEPEQLRGLLHELDVSPNGEIAAVGSTSGLWLYSTQDLTLLCSLFVEASNQDVYALQWSPDGQRLAVGYLAEIGETVLRVWDAATWEILVEMPNPLTSSRNAAIDVAWSPDGRMISYADPFTLRVINANDGETVFTQLDHTDTGSNLTKRLAWSPDGQYVAMYLEYSNSAIQVWATDTWEAVQMLIPSRGFAAATVAGASLEWSPDGKIFVAGQVPVLAFWETENWEEIRLVEADLVSNISWSPDGSRLALAGRTEIRVIDPMNGEVLLAMEGLIGEVRDVDWAVDGTRLVSIGFDDGTLRLWNATNGEQLAIVQNHPPDEPPLIDPSDHAT